MNEEHRIWTDNLQESPNYAVEQLTGIWRATVAPAPHLLVKESFLIGEYVPRTEYYQVQRQDSLAIYRRNRSNWQFSESKIKWGKCCAYLA